MIFLITIHNSPLFFLRKFQIFSLVHVSPVIDITVRTWQASFPLISVFFLPNAFRIAFLLYKSHFLMTVTYLILSTWYNMILNVLFQTQVSIPSPKQLPLPHLACLLHLTSIQLERSSYNPSSLSLSCFPNHAISLLYQQFSPHFSTVM